MLHPHQVKFAKNYKGKNLIVHEGGTGKTICACVWLHDARDNDALVICPKRVVAKWQNELTKWQTKATVVSKENFKKIPLHKWSAIVVDEADEFASPLFTKQRSKLSECLYNLRKEYPTTPILLLTATPIRSSPWNLHSLLCFAGVYLDWKKWREVFFSLEYRPYLVRPAYIPRSNWREKIRPYLEKYADIVLLKDCVEFLPAVEEKIVKIETPKFPGTDELESRRRFVVEHLHEQQNKVKAILEIAKNYRKILVVAYYIEQIKDLEKELSKDRLTFTVHGSVKKQEELLKKSNEVDECFLIVQASLGAGFDADTFSCVVFVSMSYAVRDYVQMKFRVRRIHALHPVIYYYIIGGNCDSLVKRNVDMGRDFVPSEYQSYEKDKINKK